MLMENKNITQAFPLPMATEGERVKIVGVTGGKLLIKRLIAMGLIEETELQVLQRENGVVVACGETRLALGFGIANKIQVVPVCVNDE
ncbi:MAG TPA: ferrous iron transport protein A [Thioploca sp.]|nr:MAG: ferrous iron transport protein A [Gammaproteobacteria bacterium]HDN26668.1 ferrous iron transport protein A [Thioploca sp.]